ncbi:Mitochondrial carrier domain [Pseudocohnilembus persalinus]|uniref:Mitochondrial carrier domain n=1 Tax=Pseudocohnilembus persalinus TaxID=266149 RepID=A0A0V0R9Q9_PSEPJ|nr:Mitochondrial carrier domain [Pseudocohnilembus persalinus]|eukprot:KRX11212.1 Mitochondrial carrier domain [Pseudocohnilembus persalinus]
MSSVIEFQIPETFQTQQIQEQKSVSEVFLVELFGGTIGGIVSVIVGHPLDTIRVRIQTSTSKNNGMIKQLNKAIKYEGFLSLYRGLASPIVGVPFFNAINFGTFGMFKHLLNIEEQQVAQNYQDQLKIINKGLEKDQIKKIFISGLLSGLVQSFICSPIEYFKLVMQMDTIDRHNKQSRHSINLKQGSWGVAKFIYYNQGFIGLFRGLLPTIMRDTPSFGAYFVAYEYAKNQFEQKFANKNNINEISFFSSLFGGAVAGVAAWSSTYPFDVIKTRIQMDYEGRKYTGMINCFAKSLKQEKNISFLFKGYKETIIRAIPVNAILFLGYETAIKSLNYFRSNFKY